MASGEQSRRTQEHQGLKAQSGRLAQLAQLALPDLKACKASKD
jgi:hypothetical protein